jgi:hypothetical protein
MSKNNGIHGLRHREFLWNREDFVSVKFVNAMLCKFTTDSETVCRKYLDARVGKTYGAEAIRLTPSGTFSYHLQKPS